LDETHFYTITSNGTGAVAFRQSATGGAMAQAVWTSKGGLKNNDSQLIVCLSYSASARIGFAFSKLLHVNLESVDVYAPPPPEMNAQPASDLAKGDTGRREPLGEVLWFAASEPLGALDRQVKLRSEMPHCTPKKLQSKPANLAF